MDEYMRATYPKKITYLERKVIWIPADFFRPDLKSPSKSELPRPFLGKFFCQTVRKVALKRFKEQINS